MEIEHCGFGPGEERVWDDFVHRSANAGHCHFSGWRQVIERAYDHRSFYLQAHEDGETKGILPLILIRSALFGRSLVSLPFLDDGGICSKDDETRDRLYHEAVQLFEECKADCLDLRHRQASGLDLPFYGSKVTLTLKLENNPDRMWKSFDAKLRNQIRKAIKSGIIASWTGKEGLSDFYDIFAINMRDLGSPVHDRKFFAAILDEFPNTARLILISKGNQTIGGGLCLLFKDTLLMPWASSNREYFSLCPNIFLYWEVIRWGCENGYRLFDFGRSSRGSGTYRFKKQWGANEEPLHWQCLNRNSRSTATVRADDPQYRWAVQTWKRFPLAITNFIGPLLRRQLTN